MFSPLQVEINPSAYGRGSLLFLTILSLLSIWMADLVFISKILISLVCLGYSCLCWFRLIGLNARYAVTGLRWLADRKAISVCLHHDAWVHVDRIEQKFIFPFLIGLKLKLCAPDRSVMVLIWRDSVSKDEFRKFRVLCRFAPPPVSATHS